MPCLHRGSLLIQSIANRAQWFKGKISLQVAPHFESALSFQCLPGVLAPQGVPSPVSAVVVVWTVLNRSRTLTGKATFILVASRPLDIPEAAVRLQVTDHLQPWELFAGCWHGRRQVYRLPFHLPPSLVCAHCFVPSAGNVDKHFSFPWPYCK